MVVRLRLEHVLARSIWVVSLPVNDEVNVIEQLTVFVKDSFLKTGELFD